MTSAGSPAVRVTRPCCVSSISVLPYHSTRPVPVPLLTSIASAAPRRTARTGPLMACTLSTVIGDSGPDMASLMVSSASPDSELQPVTPAMAMPSTTVRKKVFTGVSSVAVSQIIICFDSSLEEGCSGQQLADKAVPACHACSTNKHHILRLHLKLVSQDKCRGRLGVELEHGRLFVLDI